MADRHLLRTTLEVVDTLVERVQDRLVSSVGEVSGAPRLVIDEGRAAAEWALDLKVHGGVERIGLVVVCDLADGRLTDARMYVALPDRSSEAAHPLTEGMDR